MSGGIAALRALRGSLDAVGLLAVVVLATVLLLVAVRSLRARRGRIAPRVGDVLALAALAGSLAGIAGLTLFGTEGLGAEQRLALDPIAGAWGWSGIAWRPVIDNVTLFVPLGAALAAVWCRRGAATIVGVALVVSLGVELFQWAFPTGRIANSADVLANTLGAGLGVLLARLVSACPQRRSTSSKRRPDASRRRR